LKVCHRLDGIPLAIELAAARVNVLSVQQIAEKLDERFRFLTSQGDGVPPRQQTLSALLEWSYDLISEEERGMLQAVSTFTGGFSLEGAQAVYPSARDEYVVIDLLAELVDKSLVAMEERNGKARYRMLETIKGYAWMKAEEAGEGDALRDRHCDWCGRLVEQTIPELFGPDQKARLAQVEMEHDNIRAALHWSRQSENTQSALRIACLLPQFWEMRGYFTEGRAWLDSVLALEWTQAETAERARVLLGAGRLAVAQGDYANAQRYYEESLALHHEVGNKRGAAAALQSLAGIARSKGENAKARLLVEESMAIREELGDWRGIALSRNELGIMAYEEGEYERARSLHEESARLFRGLGDNRGVAYSLNRLGLAEVGRDDYASAHILHAEGLALFEELGDKWGVAWTLLYLGEVARCEEDYSAAGALYEEALTIFGEVGDKSGISATLHNLGHVERHNGDFRRAAMRFKEGLLLAREENYRGSVADCISGLAGLAGAEGQAPQSVRRAAQMFGAASALHRAIGARMEAADRREYERNLTEARSQVDDAMWAEAWAQGEAMTLEEAVVLALQPIISPPHAIKPLLPPTSKEPPSSSPYPDGLTEREVEVLRLVAAGLNNHEMAGRLSVSPHTVQAHIRSIYNKLGITSRSTATRYALDHRLT
jgi:DNA-binding CsgD family transcriptional regulator/tetratricopeptide (TPR) repeat protein